MILNRELFKRVWCPFRKQIPEDLSMSRRLITSLVLTVCAAAALGSSQQAATANGKPEDQITQLERDWLTADGKGDIASLRRIIPDDFMGSSFDGGMLSKQDIIPEHTGSGGFAGATLGDTNVRFFWRYRRPDGSDKHCRRAEPNPCDFGLPETTTGLADNCCATDAYALAFSPPD